MCSIAYSFTTLFPFLSSDYAGLSNAIDELVLVRSTLKINSTSSPIDIISNSIRPFHPSGSVNKGKVMIEISNRNVFMSLVLLIRSSDNRWLQIPTWVSIWSLSLFSPSIVCDILNFRMPSSDNRQHHVIYRLLDIEKCFSII